MTSTTPAVKATAPATVRISGDEFPVGEPLMWGYPEENPYRSDEWNAEHRGPWLSDNVTEERKAILKAMPRTNIAYKYDTYFGWDHASLSRIVTDDGATAWMVDLFWDGTSTLIEFFLTETAARSAYDDFHTRFSHEESTRRVEIYDEIDYCGKCTGCWDRDIDAEVAAVVARDGLSVEDLDKPLRTSTYEDDDF